MNFKFISNMSFKKWNYYIGGLVFLISCIQYIMTMAPTTSFWDAGEFIAVSHGLQVNHPPGAPMYSLIGRLFSMFMPTLWVAGAINMVSVVASAATIMLTYLIIIELIKFWKGLPETWKKSDYISVFGGAFIGALAMSFSDTFWFNAVEAEVYALSSFFTAIVIWMILKWHFAYKQSYSDKWLIAIAYMFGLAMGIHLLNLLCFFFITIIIYYRYYEFDLMKFSIMVACSVFAFFLMYPITLIGLPDVLGAVSDFSYGLISPLIFIIILFGAVGLAIRYTHIHRYRVANIVFICYALILLGFSSYALIYIRSQADPPIDENDPDTIEKLVYFLKREQYGDLPLLTGSTYDDKIKNIDFSKTSFFPRRYSARDIHLREYAKYNSNLDFFFRYQINHMYWRYFMWNFVGRDSDIQDSEWQSGFFESEHDEKPDHNSYYYLPLLLGLVGIFIHYKSDWKRAFSLSVLFFMTGLAIIVFLNQTPLQPRERDYVHVGSFWVYTIWIGIGAYSIIEWAKNKIKKTYLASSLVIGVLFMAVPGLMLFQNYDDHDRSGRYVASDYARNFLNSCAPNAILFTNGDNDTFPLWYAQEVEGIRTDVRIVCLSLLNTNWYIRQMRDLWSHESPPLPITLSDEEIDRITQSGYVRINPSKKTIPVDKQLLEKSYSSEEEYRKAIGIGSDNSNINLDYANPYRIPIQAMDNEISFNLDGRSFGKNAQGQEVRYLQVQDIVMLNLIENNKWIRPIYYANTTSQQAQLNLANQFRTEGKANLLMPKKQQRSRNFNYTDPDIFIERLKTFSLRNWNDSSAYYDENLRRLMSYYQLGAVQLAQALIKQERQEEASQWLDWYDNNIDFKNLQDNRNIQIMYALAHAYSNSDHAIQKAHHLKNVFFDDIKRIYDEVNDINYQIENANQRMREAGISPAERNKYNRQLKELNNKRNRTNNTIRSYYGYMIIIQHIYYMYDNELYATQLANEINDITRSEVQLPKDKAENDNLFKRTGFNIF